MSRSIPRTRPRPVEMQLPKSWGVNWFAVEPSPLGSIWSAVYHSDHDDPTIGAAFERDGSISARFERPRGGAWKGVQAGRPLPLPDGGAVFVAAMIDSRRIHYRWFQVDHTGRVVKEKDLFVDEEMVGGPRATPYTYPLENRTTCLVTWPKQTCLFEVATGEVAWRTPGTLYEGGEKFLLFSEVRPTSGIVHRVADGSRHRELTFDGKGWLRVWARFDSAVLNLDPLDEGYHLDMPAGYSSEPTRDIAVVVVDLDSGREILRAPGRITGLDPRAPVLVVTEWTANGMVERRFLHDGTLLAEIASAGSVLTGSVSAIDDVVLLRRTLDSLSCETPGAPPEQLWRMPIPPAPNEQSRTVTCVGGTIFLRDDYSRNISMFVEATD